MTSPQHATSGSEIDSTIVPDSGSGRWQQSCHEDILGPVLTRQVRPHARSLCSKPGRTSPIKCRQCPHIYVSPGIAAGLALFESNDRRPEIEIVFCEGRPTGAWNYPLRLLGCRLGCMQMCLRSRMHVRRWRVGNRVTSRYDPHRGNDMGISPQEIPVHQRLHGPAKS